MSDSQPLNSNEEPLSFREEFEQSIRSINQTLDRSAEDHKKEIAEIRALNKRNSEMIAENNRQFGGLGNRFGEIFQSLVEPSLKRILDEDFDADVVATYLMLRDEFVGIEFEIDAFGASRSRDGIAYIVETKANFEEADIKQIKRTVESFRRFLNSFETYEAYKDYEIYPILLTENISEEACDRLWNQERIHVINVTDGRLFELATPPPVPRKGLNGPAHN